MPQGPAEKIDNVAHDHAASYGVVLALYLKNLLVPCVLRKQLLGVLNGDESVSLRMYEECRHMALFDVI